MSPESIPGNNNDNLKNNPRLTIRFKNKENNYLLTKTVYRGLRYEMEANSATTALNETIKKFEETNWLKMVIPHGKEENFLKFIKRSPLSTEFDKYMVIRVRSDTDEVHSWFFFCTKQRLEKISSYLVEDQTDSLITSSELITTLTRILNISTHPEKRGIRRLSLSNKLGDILRQIRIKKFIQDIRGEKHYVQSGSKELTIRFEEEIAYLLKDDYPLLANYILNLLRRKDDDEIIKFLGETQLLSEPEIENILRELHKKRDWKMSMKSSHTVGQYTDMDRENNDIVIKESKGSAITKDVPDPWKLVGTPSAKPLTIEEELENEKKETAEESS